MKRSALGIAALFALALAGCGGGSGSGASRSLFAGQYAGTVERFDSGTEVVSELGIVPDGSVKDDGTFDFRTSLSSASPASEAPVRVRGTIRPDGTLYNVHLSYTVEGGVKKRDFGTGNLMSPVGGIILDLRFDATTESKRWLVKVQRR